jgi:predicted DNA-binding protein with PD1-like motif
VTIPRHVRQPGKPAAERITAIPAGSLPIDAILPPGIRLLDALHALLADGLESACLTLSGGALHPFAYVIPALPPDASHAAFYSDIRRPEGQTQLELAAVTLGFRNGQPHFHCHALWTEADGSRGCGHVLPDETIVAAPIHVQGSGLIGARFEVRPDAETGFDLFVPIPTGTTPPPHAAQALAIRLAPNQDLTAALEQAGRTAGFRRAQIAGGVASIIGARFTDAPQIDGFATELLVRSGHVRCAPDAARPTELHIAIIDLHGTIGEGMLTAGDNPILMTFEGVLLVM